MNEIGVKITKWKHAFKDYASNELQHKDTASAIKSKWIKLLTQLTGFKFVTALARVFKKIESKDKTKYDNFYTNSKAEIIFNVTLTMMMCFN